MPFSGPRATTPLAVPWRPRRNLSGYWQEGYRAIAVIDLTRLFETYVRTGLVMNSDRSNPLTPLHAIYGTAIPSRPRQLSSCGSRCPLGTVVDHE